MYKNLYDLHKAMRLILKNYNDTSILPDVTDNSDLSYALFCCCKNEYLLNLQVSRNCNGEYLFQKTGNIIISENGYQFLKDTSLFRSIIRKVYKFSKNVIIYICGIISALVIAYLTHRLGLT